MPWDKKDALRHTRKATSDKDKRQWRDVSNNVLKRTGDEGRAVRAANAVVGRSKRSSKRSKRKS